MDSKRASGVALFGIIILALIWGLLSLLPKGVVNEQTKGSLPASVVASSSVETVTVYHSVTKEVHTYSGVIDLPTPCHVLNTSTSVSYASSTNVVIALTIDQPAGVCAQTMTQQKFLTSVSSKSVPDLSVSINGKDARVVLLEK